MNSAVLPHTSSMAQMMAHVSVETMGSPASSADWYIAHRSLYSGVSKMLSIYNYHTWEWCALLSIAKL